MADLTPLSVISGGGRPSEPSRTVFYCTSCLSREFKFVIIEDEPIRVECSNCENSQAGFTVEYDDG